jgi:hypothetical protein
MSGSKIFLRQFIQTWYSAAVMLRTSGLVLLLWLFAVLLGCATRVASPEVTLWAGLNNYHETMRTLEAKPERWPDRQRLAESIKTTHVATLGGSREFNRLVDLDLKRRELVIAQREGGLKPDRARQVQADLTNINEQIDGLTTVVKRQFANGRLRTADSSQMIETVATVGLLNLAIDAFSSITGPTSNFQVSTQVGPYLVIDEGLMSWVKTPDGQTFRCTTAVVPDEGAFMRCEAAGANARG